VVLCFKTHSFGKQRTATRRGPERVKHRQLLEWKKRHRNNEISIYISFPCVLMKCTCTYALLSVKGLSAAKHASYMVLHETWRVTSMYAQIVTLTSYQQTTNPHVHLLHHFPPADQNNGCKEGFHPALSFTKKYQRWTRRVHKSSIMYQTSRCSTSWQRHKANSERKFAIEQLLYGKIWR